MGFPGSSAGRKSAFRAGALGCEDSLEKGTATQSSILAWRIPWTKEPGRLHTVSPWGRKESDTTERHSLSVDVTSKFFLQPTYFHPANDQKIIAVVQFMIINTLLDYNGPLQLNLYYSWNSSNNLSFSLFPNRNLGQEEDETGEVISSPCVVFLFLLLLLWAETGSPCSLTVFRLSYLNPWVFLGGSVNKESACNSGDPGLIPESRRSPGEGIGNQFQYYCLGNPMNRGAWWATVYRVAKTQTWLSD